MFCSPASLASSAIKIDWLSACLIVASYLSLHLRHSVVLALLTRLCSLSNRPATWEAKIMIVIKDKTTSPS
jgi:hypothetical protein